jgi:hypothetical protein
MDFIIYVKFLTLSIIGITQNTIEERQSTILTKQLTLQQREFVVIYISVYSRFVAGNAIIAEAGWNGSYLQTSLIMGYNTKPHLPSDPNPSTRDPGLILCSNALSEIRFCAVVYKTFSKVLMMMAIMMVIDNIASGNRENPQRYPSHLKSSNPVFTNWKSSTFAQKKTPSSYKNVTKTERYKIYPAA